MALRIDENSPVAPGAPRIPLKIARFECCADNGGGERRADRVVHGEGAAEGSFREWESLAVEPPKTDLRCGR